MVEVFDDKKANQSLLTSLRSLPLLPAIALCVAYLCFVQFFGTTGLQGADEWDFLNYYSAFKQGTLSFAMLWQPAAGIHRVFIPNLVYLADASYNHLDTKTLMVLSGFCYAIAFIGILLAFVRAYSTKISAWAVLVIGLIWFSLVNNQIALWGAGFGNYFVVTCLVGLLFSLSRTRLSVVSFCAAALFAVLASYTLVTGLILWVVGLLCLIWRKWRIDSGRVWIPTWCVLGVVTTYFYFRNINLGKSLPGSVSPLTALIHFPIQTLKFFLILLSGVIPGSSSAPGSFNFRMFVGTIVLFSFVAVVVVDIFLIGKKKLIPISSCLIFFALVCDVETATGRMFQGYEFALASRYALPNIVAIVGVIFFFLSIRINGEKETVKSRQLRGFTSLGAVVLILFCLVQISTSTVFGLQQSFADKTSMEMTNRTFANLDGITDGNQRFALLIRYGSPYPTDWGKLVPLAEKYRLGVFYPPVFQIYKQLGPPTGVPDVQFKFPPK
jgi:hypothetical protein